MSRAALFQQLLDQAAKELRCKVTDEKAKHVAVLRLALESVQTKLIAGRDIDPSALRWLSEQLEKYATPPPEPTTLTIQYIDGTRKTCPFCKATFNPHDPDPKPLPPEPPLPPSRRLPATASAADTGNKPKPFSKPPTSADVVPIRRSTRNDGGPG